MSKTIHADSIGTTNVAHVAFRNPLSATILSKAWHALKDWNNRRIAVRELSAMPDALLRDIGIERYQIREVVRHGGARSQVHALRQPTIKRAARPAEIKKAA
ncbi:MAG: DUF1127 domain-containing protein [bacterium]